jgi:heat shock protein HslJ
MNMMTRNFLNGMAFVAIFSLASSLPALAQNAPAEKKPGALSPMQGKAFPINVQWELVSLNGKPVDDIQPTVVLDTQLRMRGFAGCNTYSATAYPMKNQGIAVGPLALTKKECEKPVMELEKAYLLALRTSQQWQIKDGALYMLGEKAELKFQRALF